VCRRRQRRRRSFDRPDREACVAGEKEAFVIVEGHYSVRAEMCHAAEVASRRKAVVAAMEMTTAEQHQF
jgi:hypothetical protein